MTEEKLRLILMKHILEKYGSQEKAGEVWGITQGRVSHMVTGRTPISKSVLDELGYKKIKIATYEKVNPPK